MKPDTLIFAGLAIVVLGVFTGQPFMMAPGMLLVAVVTIAGLWTIEAVCSSVNCRVHLENHRVRWATEVDGQVTVENAQPLPLPWLDVRAEWPAELPVLKGAMQASHKPGRREFRSLLSLRWFERVSRKFRVRCLDRGEYLFGPVEMVFGDPFGFYEQRKLVESTERLVVYPRTVKVNWEGALSRSPFGDRAMRSWVFDDPSYARGAREYLPTDPFSRIEWKATARTGSLHTKMLDAAFCTELAIVVNVSTGESVTDGIDRDMLERTIVVAASLAAACHQVGYRFGVYTNGLVRQNPHPAAVNMGEGPAHLDDCMEVLGRLLAMPGARCEAVLDATCGKINDRARVVLVTGAVTRPLARAAQRQALRGRPVAIVVTSPGPGDWAHGVPLGAGVFSVAEQEAWNELEHITIRKIRR